MAASDAKPFPIKGSAYRVTFPILDADGDLVTGAAGLDSEISKDGGTFADCTNEATEIATNSGVYYLDLTATEMNADTVAIIIKTSTSGAKTTVLVLYPLESGDISGVTLADDAITASKFDESTAFPLVSADSGATAVARTGADSDTLETLSDQLDACAVATDLATVAGYIDTEVAAIKAKTDLIPASPAAVGSAMTLADDAITASKFDESTAFPLKSADTGATAVARTGADSDTLETLSDQLDGVNVTKWCGETLTTPGDAGWNGN